MILSYGNIVKGKDRKYEVLDGIYLLFTHIGIWIDSGYRNVWGMAMSEAFRGFVQPTKNYFPMPNEWIDICAGIDNLSELKVIQYVLRHTWGFQEFGITKTISTDEFMYGRKRNDGTRIDNGTGLKSDRSVKDGVKNALKHGYLICETDDTDKARTKKSYALKMQVPIDGYNLPPQIGQVDTTPLSGSIYPSGVQNLPIGGAKSTHRSEKDTIETHLKKDTIETQKVTDASAIASAALTPFEQSAYRNHIQVSRQVGHDGITSATFADIVAAQEAVAPKASVPLPTGTPANENESHSQKKEIAVPATPGSEQKPIQQPPKPPRKPKSALDDVTQKRVDDFYSYLDELKQEVLGDTTSAYQRTQKATEAIMAILPLMPTQRKVKKVFLDMWNEKGKDGQYFWRRHMKPHNICSEYESRIMALEGKTLPSADAPVRNIVRADDRMREQYRLDRERAAQQRKAN